MKTLRLLLFLFMIGTTGDLAAQDRGEGVGPVDRTGANPSTPVRRPESRERAEGPKSSPFADPRRWLFLAVVGFLVIGGGRKWLHGRKGRSLADRLAAGTASVDEIRDANKYGRIVVHDLFRVLAEGQTQEHRIAATEALVKLWRADELIPEEEKAIVSRSFSVDWRIRRKYPKGLKGPIGIRAFFGLPRLSDDELNLWLYKHLQWAYRVTGTRRASDDTWQEPQLGLGQVRLTVMAEDFPDDGPHRIVLQMKAETKELTDQWTLELPAQSISFETDEKLSIGALAGMPDSSRAELMRNAIEAWVPHERPDPAFSVLDDRFAIRNPPGFKVVSSLTADLAHQAILEIEGISGRWSIGEWVVSERSTSQVTKNDFGETTFIIIRSWPETLERLGDAATLERGGNYRARVVLEPRPERGWSDPDIRSVWPEPIMTDWFEVEIVRR